MLPTSGSNATRATTCSTVRMQDATNHTCAAYTLLTANCCALVNDETQRCIGTSTAHTAHRISASCRQVVVTRVIPGTTTEKELARFGVGDFFGENALIENKPRDAAVTAGTQRLNAAVNARLPHRNTPMRALTWCGLGLVRLSDAVADAVA